MQVTEAKEFTLQTKDLEFFDDSRKRRVPVKLYYKTQADFETRLVVINHGYQVKNDSYYFIAKKLVENGYIVMSIQHELRGDGPLPKKGNLVARRLPLWQRGAANIAFAINELYEIMPQVRNSKLILLGHSNGGDIGMYFAKQSPLLLSHIISLDNLRMQLPLNADIKILYLHANDTVPDQGVLPADDDQEKYAIEIIALANIKHNDMTDNGPIAAKNQISQLIIDFLSES